jgi:DNA adenine methylase
LFSYLNQTSFNGIYRVNLKGEYNVPYGYRTKNFLEPEKLRLVSKKLQKTNLFQSDFDNVRDNIKKRDLIFLDPPYTVSHNNNGFIKYNQKIFSLDDQKRLSSFIDFIKQKDAYFIMTNASHKIIDDIFEKGDYKIELERASLIGGSKAKRGQVTEYVFSNTKL